LNGTQLRFHLPHEVAFAGTTSAVVTQQGDSVVLTLGRLAIDEEQTVQIPVTVSSKAHHHDVVHARAHLHSSTAMPLETNVAFTRIR
jgi:hypothetical protein